MSSNLMMWIQLISFQQAKNIRDKEPQLWTNSRAACCHARAIMVCCWSKAQIIGSHGDHPDVVITQTIGQTEDTVHEGHNDDPDVGIIESMDH